MGEGRGVRSSVPLPGLGLVSATVHKGFLVDLDLGGMPGQDLSEAVPGSDEARLLDQVFAELSEYAGGKRRVFTLPWRLEGMTDFGRQVLGACAEIPWGETATYGELAHRIGNPGAVRAVGGALGRNPLPIVIPCHRVLAASGIGGFSGGLDWKRRLLGVEAIVGSRGV